MSDLFQPGACKQPRQLPVLRDVQKTALEAISGHYRAGRKRVMLQASVAFGKSTVASYMMSKTKLRTLILAPRVEIVQQISRALTVPHGLLMPGYPETTHPLQVAMVPTAIRRIDRLPDFDWIISDEAHLSAAAGWATLLDLWKDKFHLGMSATPCRLDNMPLKFGFDVMVQGPSTQEMVDLGYLVPAQVYAPPINMGEVRVVRGEYDQAEAEKTLGKRELIGDAVDQWRKHAEGRKTIVFCCSIAHAEAVSRQFNMSGIRSLTVDGKLDKDERKRRFAEFEQGNATVLCNVDIATTGYDFPALSCVVWLRKTKSIALWRQGNGRGARLSPATGKVDYICLDHANNSKEHGHPHEEPEWSLDGKPKRNASATLRQCKKCYKWVPLARVCENCGAVTSAEVREAPETVAGDLVKVEADEMRQLREGRYDEIVRAAISMADFQKIAKARGYRSGWAWRAYTEKRNRTKEVA